ncbi:hypothetical protein [Chitinophaga sp. 212800010-3]|uniref:hypothetical protein n=1 Tax=unclassified Chitinophaga TaxID=2619133 RepID=UPI002DEA436E|nr:Lipoprotein [Chitinophaga sp. 212800010-3]
MRTTKNFILSASVLLCSILLGACTKQEQTGWGWEKLQTGTNVKVTANGLTTPVNLLTDADFQKGFNVLHPTTGAVQGPLQYTTANGTPVWNLAQWYSVSSIYGATPVVLGSGSTQFANPYKAVTLGPLTSTDHSLIFAINGQSEFNNVYRKASDPFPALLADLKIADPDGWLGTTTPFIGVLSSVQFSIDALLQYHNRNQQPGYDSAIHAIQFSCTFLIQNLRQGNPGYGKSMYFLVMLFDDRYPLPGKSVSTDLFTGKLIYDVGLTPFSTSGLTVGQWKTVSGNLLPLIKDGLNEAWSRDILTESQSYNDYKISLFTMGWECPGLNIGTMQVRNLSLVAN